MTPDDALWRKRFGIFALLRVSGLLLFFIGMAIVFSDLVRPGGALGLGMVVIGCGLVEALLGPVMLRQHWEKTDRR
jgi:membrane-bound ClpP family serine protease